MKLLEVLRENQKAICWSLFDLKGNSPYYFIHKIHVEQDYKPVAQP